jgi:cell division protein ZapA
MATPTEQISLTILDREYRVACTPDDKPVLLQCARLVDEKMRSIRDAGKVLGNDRVAVMAALQIAQELHAARASDGAPVVEVRRKLRELNGLADEMLAPQEKLF